MKRAILLASRASLCLCRDISPAGYMLYREHIPAPPLSHCIRMLWYTCVPQEDLAVSSARQRVLPNGCIQVVISLARDYLLDCPETAPGVRCEASRMAPALIVGARSVYEIVDTSDMADLIGIVFKPGGMAPFFREAAHLFSNRSTDLASLWGNRAARLRNALRDQPTPDAKLRILEHLLREEIAPDLDLARNPLVEFALQEFARAPLSASVRQVALRTGWSERRFSQIFREEVGLSPKLWCRIQRFQRVVRELHTGREIQWSNLALDCGYYDQSHFSNDFRAFSGINPTTYSTIRTRWANHIAAE